MNSHIVIAIKLTLITVLLFGIIYPVLITGVATLVAPQHGDGQQVYRNETALGFELIGQQFNDDRYFQGRPSAVNYNAAGTGGSNKGPTNPEYLVQVKARIDTFIRHNPDVRFAEIPVDLVTASGGGLDPHISPAAARIQIPRIARLRNLDPGKLKAMVEDHIEGPVMGLGTSRVHVLRLNLALDRFESNQ